MQLFFQPDIQKGVQFLDPDESRHCIKVLRKSVGDIIQIIDGKGALIAAKVTEANVKKCRFEVQETKIFPPDDFHIHIAIAPTKNIDRLEWFVEKSVEIGVHEISFIFCQNSERTVLKIERLEKKAISAMKQSGRFFLPTINQPCPFDEWLEHTIKDEHYIAHLREDALPLFKTASAKEKYAILVGPEGDFTSQEIEKAIKYRYKLVSLGNSRLRTETAGIVACHILNLINQ